MKTFGHPGGPNSTPAPLAQPLREGRAFGFLALMLLLLTACRHPATQAQAPVPPPPPPAPQAQAAATSSPPAGAASLPPPQAAKPIAVETGLASWYGPPYHNRRGSNGEIYDMHAMTAAHRTLPLGSIVRVTNIKTGTSAVVRITDRGPFVKGRIIDLSLAAAQKIGVWQPGIAEVRLDVLESPHPLNQGGRWAVQIGPLADEGSAEDLRVHLSRRYSGAKVLSFSSPVGDWWVRVRVQADDRVRASEVARDTQTSQGSTFLVRLD